MRNRWMILAGVFSIASPVFATPQADVKPLPVKTTHVRRAVAMPVFVRSASNEMAGAIRVSVNGDLVNFASGEPVEADGRILVPMRGVFEALGASVRYDNATGSIEAVRGDTSIALRPGDETALVNGEVRPLDSPVQVVNGAAVVPLRFVSEMFGARVNWNADTYEVTVSTDALVAKALPPAPEGDSVFGTLTGAFPEAHLLTVRLAGGENVRVPLTYDVSATRRTRGADGSETATESKPVFGAGALKLGEQIQVELNDKFEGLLVLVDTNVRRGAIKSIEAAASGGGNQVTLTDGTVVVLTPDAKIAFGDREVPLSAVKTAENAVIRLNDAGQGVSLTVTQGSEPAPVAAPVPSAAPAAEAAPVPAAAPPVPAAPATP